MNCSLCKFPERTPLSHYLFLSMSQISPHWVLAKSTHLFIFLIIVILKSFVKIGNCEFLRKFNRKERKELRKKGNVLPLCVTISFVKNRPNGSKSKENRAIEKSFV